MNLPSFLESLSDGERNFISGLDYGNDFETHREALDLIISRGGDVDMDTQSWFPYEVIELGKNWLQDGHEREFVACAAIVCHNIIRGSDLTNDIEIGLEVVTEHIEIMSPQHRSLLEPLLLETVRYG